MAKSVGPVNIKVGMNAAGAFATIAQVENRLKKTAATTSRLGKGVGAFGAGVAKALPGGGLLGGLGAADLGAGAAGILVRTVQGTMDHIRELGKLSQRLGVTTETMVTLEYAANRAGVDTDLLTTSLFKMRQVLGEAQMGGASQIRTLQQLGLTYEDIARLPVDQQFGLIADRLNQVSDVNQRAALTVEIFGRSGQQLGILLQRGSAGLEAMRRDAELLGLTFSKQDLERIKNLNSAWKRSQKALEGAGNQLTLALIPVLEGTAAVVTDLSQALIGLSSTIRGLVALIPGGGGTVSNLAQISGRIGTAFATSGLSEIFLAIQRANTLANPQATGAATTLAAAMHPAVTSGTRPIVERIIALDNDLIQGFESLQKSLQDELSSLQGVSRLDQELARLTTAFEAQLQQATAPAPGPLGGIVPGINNLLNMFGLTTASAAAETTALQKLRERFRLETNIARALDEQIRNLKNRQQLERDATELITRFQGPLKGFQVEAGRFQQLLQRGLIDPNTFGAATAQAFQQLADSLPQAPTSGPEALQQGSIAAQAAINRFNRQGGAVSLQEQIRNVLRQSQQIQQQQLAQQRETVRILAGLGVVAPAGLGGP